MTFLRLDPGVAVPAAPMLSSDVAVLRVEQPSVSFYRYLYDTVGADYCWWLRRISTDEEIASLMRDPQIGLFVAMQKGEPAGFFELDARTGADVNLAYFGLLPHAIGTGIGFPLLLEAMRVARLASRNGSVRVNTCTADHPRALPTYLRAGFVKLRTVREIWDIPDRLGLRIPDRLRV
ncbi:GNAT family N-acetyltransferase [Endosaccharibacter trunci]|uniref:GNAT family N-acetyltransferase n=1 Tax=Endosaccharibacter trunci TaxID=2812733 RepID=UPI003BF5B765